VFLIDLMPGFSTTNIVRKIGRAQVGASARN
jgi:hypothetical protein